jgi:general secretion pathway protein C
MGLDVQLRRCYWAVPWVVVAACSSLTATAVAHVIAGAALEEPEVPVRERSPLAVGASLSVAGPGGGRALVDRNLFCSDCEPAVVMPVVVEATGSAPPATSLPLLLVATNVSSVDEASFATIRNTSSAQQGAYGLGSSIPGVGPVRRIGGTWVDFENRTAQRVERVSMRTVEAAPSVAAPAPAPATPARTEKDALTAEVAAGVRQLSENTFEVDRALIDKLLANPTGLARGARVAPSAKNGKPDGFRMRSVRPGSAFAAIGLQSGDVVHAVNGFELTSMDKALEVYTKVRQSTRLSVDVTRRGKPIVLEYAIR